MSQEETNPSAESQKKADEITSRYMDTPIPKVDVPAAERRAAASYAALMAAPTWENFAQHVNALETSIDAKLGVARVPYGTFSHVNGNEAPLIMRDGRGQSNQKNPANVPEDTRETWQVTAATRAKGALFMIEQLNSDGKVNALGRDNKTRAAQDVMKIFADCNTQLEKATSPAAREKILNQMDTSLIKSFQNSGLTFGSGSNAMDLSKEKPKVIGEMLKSSCSMSNLLGENHPTTISISDNLVAGARDKSGQPFKVTNEVTTLAPAKPYDGDASIKTTGWYKSLASSSKPLDRFRRQLVDKCQTQLEDGKHLWPTQERYLGGLRNCYAYAKKLFQGKEPVKLQSDQPEFGLKKGAQAEVHGTRGATPVYGAGKCKDPELLKQQTQANIDYIGKLNGNKDKEIVSANHENKIVKPLNEAAQSTGAKVDNCAISKDMNKAANLKRGAMKLLTSAAKYAYTCCKSGKDRTAAMIKEAGCKLMKAFGKDIGLDKKQIVQAERISQRMHTDEMAAGGRGASQGAYGTKIANVYRGLIHGSIKNLKSLVSNRICNQNEIYVDSKKKRVQNLARDIGISVSNVADRIKSSLSRNTNFTARASSKASDMQVSPEHQQQQPRRRPSTSANIRSASV